MWRLGYADEVSTDRHQGVLWGRRGIARGQGVPLLKEIHPIRQRQALGWMRCQVDKTDTYENTGQDGRTYFSAWGERHLFLQRSADGRPIEDGELTMSPPVCLPCAVESVSEGGCPFLRRGYAAALVQRTELWGVNGLVYDGDLQPHLSDSKDGMWNVAYGDPAARWVVAAGEIVRLCGVTPVDLADLAAQNGLLQPTVEHRGAIQ
ncbi:hypothetical protein B7C62_17010 [Kitasatospora albolonga]|uniref:Uncharacterized protein n=2 Tax=Kitasatospora albolonga TaxID=68173 RepID=A0ABC8BUA7_9ACTN|nr:hypothetical protein B7C62_17010 [Kitasatospora albolonga]